MSERGEHWDGIYAASAPTALSWYQRDPATSLRLIEEAVARPSGAVVDVGGGESLLVEGLLARGFTDVTVLDVSERALDDVRQRLGEAAEGVEFIQQDVVSWVPDRLYDVWHDRAVFHFLVDAIDRGRYVDVATDAIRDGGCLVLATFAEDGPTQCSGLPVCRYSAGDLAAVFRASFVLALHEREEHITPRGTVQAFTWVVLRRT